MHLIDAAGHVGNQFAHEDPTTNRPPTEVDDTWLNAVQNEIANAITGMGIPLDKSDHHQLFKALEKISGGHMFEIKPWVGGLESMPKGFFPLSGVPVTEVEVPGITQAIIDTNQPYCYAADRSDPLKAGMWGIGVGYVITPDWNGASANSIGGLYFAGDLGGQRRGVIVSDAIREIAGKVVSNDNTAYQFLGEGPFKEVSGAFEVEYKTGASITDSAAHTAAAASLTFRASKVHPVASEVRPKSTYGTWMIRLYGGITNVGSLDAAALVASVNALKSRVEVLEARQKALGDGQTRSSSAGYVDNVTYPNPVQRTCEVRVSGTTSAANGGAQIQINGVVKAIASTPLAVGFVSTSVILLKGEAFKVIRSSMSEFQIEVIA